MSEPDLEGIDPTDGGALRAFAERERDRRVELEGQLSASETVRRENAMLRAKVDIDSPLGAMFNRGYDGELTPEAISTAWTAIQPARPETTPLEPAPATEAELAAQTERSALVAGASPPGTEPSPDPYDEGYAAFHKAMKAGRRREDAAAEVINRVVDAAVKGDPRVVFDEREFAERQRLAGHRRT